MGVHCPILSSLLKIFHNKMLKTQTNETARQQPPVSSPSQETSGPLGVCSGPKSKSFPRLLLRLVLNTTPGLEEASCITTQLLEGITGSPRGPQNPSPHQDNSPSHAPQPHRAGGRAALLLPRWVIQPICCLQAYKRERTPRAALPGAGPPSPS